MLCPFRKEKIWKATQQNSNGIVLQSEEHESFKECEKEKCMSFVKSVDKYNKDYCKLCK